MVLEYEEAGNPATAPAAAGRAAELTCSAMAERARLPCGEPAELFACVRIKAPEPDGGKDSERPPVKLSSVLDRSGSMQGEKLDLCKGSIKYAVKQMTERDQFGLITYDDSVKEEFPMSYMTEANKARCLDRIDRIKEGGCTNLEGGLFAGIKQAQAAQRACPLVLGNTHEDAGDDKHRWTVYLTCSDPALLKQVRFSRGPGAEEQEVCTAAPFQTSGVSWGVSTVAVDVTLADGETMKFKHDLSFDRDSTEAQVGTVSPAGQADTPTIVWLFTDGLANSGVLYRKPESLYEEVRKRCRGTNTLVSTFGYGEDHDPKMLRGICEAGRGQYNWIENSGMIAEAFGACLGGVLSVAATDLRVTLIPTAGVGLEVVTQFESSETGDGAHVVSIPDLYEGEQRDVVLRVRVPALPGPQDQTCLVAVAAAYNNLTSKKAGSCACAMTLARPEAVSDPGFRVELDVQRNRINAADAMRLGRQKADSGKLDEGRDIIAKAKAAIMASPSAQDPYCVDLVDDLNQCADGMRDRRRWMTKGSAYTNCSEMGHYYQRSCNHSKPMQYGTRRTLEHRAACKASAEGPN